MCLCSGESKAIPEDTKFRITKVIVLVYKIRSCTKFCFAKLFLYFIYLYSG